MKINIFIHLIFVAACLSINAQQIQNIRFEQEGKKINIYYDLIGEAVDVYNVEIYCSYDGGNTWGKPLKHVTGDTGENIKSGINKFIIWDVLVDREYLTGEISFKITVANTIKTGTFIDSRDNKKYKWVRIGDKIWMAENLKYKSSGRSWCYNNNSFMCDEYGRLYSWQSAKTACPKGWHLPSKTEFEALLNYYGGRGKNNGDEIIIGGDSGFDALLGGWRDDNGSFLNVEIYAYFMSSTAGAANNVWSLGIHKRKAYIESKNYIRYSGFSVRCIKN